MQDYAKFYKDLTAFLRENPVALFLVRILNIGITYLMYLLYPLLLLYIVWVDWERLFLYAFVPAVGFLAVTIARKWVNQPRPYEKWKITPLLEKDTLGQSMPSRHVFSATIISMCFLDVSVHLGVILMLLSAILAICRVVGGVHYPKDVLVGLFVGILCGLPIIL